MVVVTRERSYPPKTSRGARFRGLWVVVVARDYTPRIRAPRLAFEGGGWLWLPVRGLTLENKVTALFSGVVGGGGG